MLKIKKSYKKLLFYLFVFLFILSSIRMLVLMNETNYDSENIKNIERIKNTNKNRNFSFIVLGNIKNTQLIFHKKNVEKLNNDNSIFIISLGNAVFDGAEFKFNLINKNFLKINKPIILVFGKNERADGGYKRFYHHYGPFYFSFQLMDSYFIFLDTTGETPLYLQKDWLIRELILSQKYKRRFVFMQKSPIIFKDLTDIYDEGYCIKDDNFRKFLMNLFKRYRVTSVFSGAAPIFNHTIVDGVDYFNTGCAGGTLLLNNPKSFYHYLKVNVNSKVQYKIIHISNEKKSILIKLIYNMLYYIDSFFYLSFFNFILILSAVFIIITNIYKRLSKPVNYYRNFTNNNHCVENKKLTIVMFTNNYLPFIGGVPISIQRLATGLRRLGHKIYIFAPEYKNKNYEKCKDEKFIFRYKSLFYYKKHNLTIPIPNIFSLKMKKKFILLKADIVHLHHPYWIGSIGLKLAKKYKIPTVYTYHTRLEMYAHNLPIFHKLFTGEIPHKLIKNFANKCDAIIAPTNTAKEYLRNLGVGKIIKIIPTGIDFSKYVFSQEEINILKEKYKPNGELILFTVSRLSKEKNLYFLLEGIKYIINNTKVNFNVLIAGNGPEKDAMLNFIKQNDLEKNVTLLGSILPNEIGKYFMIADIFIFTSKSETQGMVLLEAMAGKTPVVAVRSSGIEDVIKDGVNGFKTEEDISKWANKVILLMENHSKLKELSENAYSFAKSFSTDKISVQVLKLYYEIRKNKQEID